MMSDLGIILAIAPKADNTSENGQLGLYQNLKHQGWRCCSVVELLSTMCKALDLILDNFSASKVSVNSENSTWSGKILANHVSNTGLISRICISQ